MRVHILVQYLKGIMELLVQFWHVFRTIDFTFQHTKVEEQRFSTYLINGVATFIDVPVKGNKQHYISQSC